MSTLIKRYFFFILGLIINSFGVAFISADCSQYPVQFLY